MLDSTHEQERVLLGQLWAYERDLVGRTEDEANMKSVKNSEIRVKGVREFPVLFYHFSVGLQLFKN